MYLLKIISSTTFMLALISFLLNLTNASPILTSSSSVHRSNENAFESTSTSSLIVEQQLTTKRKPLVDLKQTIETNDNEPKISKILRLLNSLSYRSIPKSSSDSNFDFDEIKKVNDLKTLELKQPKFNDNKLNDNLNEDRFILNERFNDNLSIENLKEKPTENANEHENSNNNNLLQKIRENLEKFNEKLFFIKYLPSSKTFSLSSKYPVRDEQAQEEETNSEYNKQALSTEDKLRKMSEIISDDDEFARAELKNQAFVKILSNLNEQAEEENRQNEKDRLERLDLEHELENRNHKKNLYDMVENEEEDKEGLGEQEEHMHNYNISLFSDKELERTFNDIQWLLNQNLSKEEFENKFRNKGRNNRNRIASRMEYFEKLYRNLHHLPLPNHKYKKDQGPQLSVVSPLDVLRDKLILEIARRKIEQSKSQMQKNEEFLKKVG